MNVTKSSQKLLEGQALEIGRLTDGIKIVAAVARISATFVSHLNNNFVMFKAGPVAVPKGPRRIARKAAFI
jgi:hypothetical protein